MTDTNVAKDVDNANADNILFYFRSEEPDSETYSITLTQVELVGLFKNMYDSNPDDYTDKNKPLILALVNQPDENFTDVNYQINTNLLLSYVNEYLTMVKGKELTSDYCEEKHVSAGDYMNILSAEDVAYIEKFIESYKTLVHKFDAKRYVADASYKVIVKIKALAVLLSQIDNFLELESLAKKLYTYIAGITWNTSLTDIADAEKDPEFQRMQENAANTWRAKNPDKAAHYAPGVTTGDGKGNGDDSDGDVFENTALAAIAEDD